MPAGPILEALIDKLPDMRLGWVGIGVTINAMRFCHAHLAKSFAFVASLHFCGYNFGIEQKEAFL